MGQPYMVDTVKLFCVFSFFQIGTTVQIRDYIYYTRVKVAFGDLMLGPSGLGSLRSHVCMDMQMKSVQKCARKHVC